MAPRDVIFVLLYVNSPTGRMGVSWIKPPSTLLIDSKAMTKTIQVLPHYIHGYEYARVVNNNIDSYNKSNISLIIIMTFTN